MTPPQVRIGGLGDGLKNGGCIGDQGMDWSVGIREQGMNRGAEDGLESRRWVEERDDGFG